MSSNLHQKYCKMDADDNVPIHDTTYYKHEQQRLNTFVGIQWTSPVSQYLLAQHGFYWTGSEDNCRCAFCRLEIRGWQLGDTPWGEHQRWNPGCQYHQNKVCGNVKIGDQTKNTKSTHTNILESLQNPISQQFPYIPKHGNYDTLKKRLDSYLNWPSSSAQKPIVLANAGFFYTGVREQVICFHCGNCLADWVNSDSPWLKHVKVYPTCFHLQSEESKQQIQHETLKQETGNVSINGFPIYPTYPDFLDRSKRSKTFENCSTGFNLAEYGFFYDDKENCSKCFFCGFKVDSWNKNDLPWDNHETLCTFAAMCHGTNTVKIKQEPVESTSTDKDDRLYEEQKETINNLKRKFQSIEEGENHLECSKKANMTDYAITPAALPDYFILDKRVESFKHFPIALKPIYKELSEAGFLFTGVGDQVQCFQCGGKLKDWSKTDSPWLQHYKCFPDCCFLLLKMKENSIIKQMIENTPDQDIHQKSDVCTFT